MADPACWVDATARMAPAPDGPPRPLRTGGNPCPCAEPELTAVILGHPTRPSLPSG
ncbi:hypothetical protein [Streptomyces sp. IMTB 2501]|uniref:hypothetical protein n=1 Tax=Streptomyces sp. IMTB 2501 TaxID=1776340 RepID=UPI0015BD4BFD|nr:hypothetical protein [Streptomyces sp. IMTB 2501]